MQLIQRHLGSSVEKYDLQKFSIFLCTLAQHIDPSAAMISKYSNTSAATKLNGFPTNVFRNATVNSGTDSGTNKPPSEAYELKTACSKLLPLSPPPKAKQVAVEF